MKLLYLGPIAQLARAHGLHPWGRGFESLSVHFLFFFNVVRSINNVIERSLLDDNTLKKLLRECNAKGYADPNSKYVDNGKDGKILHVTIDNFTYEDEYYGGEPYSGNETIWENGKVIFRCVYWGKVGGGINFSDMYEFLREALSKGPHGELVHRGPSEYVGGNVKYTNSIEGNITEFRQTERMYLNDKEVYVAYFIGGRVNTQNN